MSLLGKIYRLGTPDDMIEKRALLVREAWHLEQMASIGQDSAEHVAAVIDASRAYEEAATKFRESWWAKAFGDRWRLFGFIPTPWGKRT